MAHLLKMALLVCPFAHADSTPSLMVFWLDEPGHFGRIPPNYLSNSYEEAKCDYWGGIQNKTACIILRGVFTSNTICSSVNFKKDIAKCFFKKNSERGQQDNPGTGTLGWSWDWNSSTREGYNTQCVCVCGGRMCGLQFIDLDITGRVTLQGGGLNM